MMMVRGNCLRFEGLAARQGAAQLVR